jgi:hypothetical protein
MTPEKFLRSRGAHFLVSPQIMKPTQIPKSLAAGGAFLTLAAATQAHPGHSVFDAFAGMPHAGHEAESLVFFVATVAVVAAAVRAWRQAGE